MTEQQGEWLYEVEERLGLMGVMGPPTETELSAALACVPGAERPSIIGGRLVYVGPPAPGVAGGGSTRHPSATHPPPATRQEERPVPPPPLSGVQVGLFGERR